MSDQEQDVEMENQVEEPKRGRGRPKRTAVASKAKPNKADKPENSAVSDDLPVKRGRGRPPSAAAKSKDKVEKVPKAKKPTVSEASNGIQDAAKAPAKRRGRQPKAAAEEKEPKSEDEQGSEEEGDDEVEPAPPAKPKAAKAAGRKATKNAAKNGHAKDDESEEEKIVEDDESEEEKLEDDESEKSDVASGESRIKIVVEHCKSCNTFRRKADEIITALKEKWSNIEVEYNPGRKGAFEITLLNNGGSDVKLWTGLELGPPRKLKFPDPDIVVEAMKKAYVPESA